MLKFCNTCKSEELIVVDGDTLDNKKVTKDTQAICSSCKGTITDITQFALKSLASMGKIWRPSKPTEAFSFFCKPCRDVKPAKLDETKTKALCSECTTDMNLTAFAIKAMKIANK